jgi:hypothetical protein
VCSGACAFGGKWSTARTGVGFLIWGPGYGEDAFEGIRGDTLFLPGGVLWGGGVGE